MHISFRSILGAFAIVAFSLLVLRGVGADSVSPDEAADAAREPLVQDITQYLPEEQAIRNAMKRPVAITAERLPLAKVMGQLVNEYALNIMVDSGALKQEGIQDVATVPVSFAAGRPLDETLDDMLDDVGLSYQLSRGCIHVTSLAKVAAEPEMRVYDVRQLLPRGATAEDVGTLLRNTSGKLGPVEVKGHGAILIVRHTRRGHAMVLKRLTAMTPEQIEKLVEERRPRPAGIPVRRAAPKPKADA